MKPLKLISALVLSAMISITACKKEGGKLLSDAKQKSSAGIKQKDTKSKSIAAVIAGIEVSCSGTCDGSEEVCHLTRTMGEVTTVDCHCEGCTMEVSTIADLSSDLSLLSNLDFVWDDFNSYLDSIYPLEDIEVSSISIFELQSGSIITQIDYLNSTSTIDENLTYKLDFDSKQQIDKKTRIDCSGGCDAAGLRCREQINVDSGDVSCTCEGSCAMTIETIPNLQ